MSHCPCGGKLGRIHRSFTEKLAYMAVYRCRDCGALKRQPRGFMFYFAEQTRCPKCGTGKLHRLAEPDHIDPMYWNLFRLARPLVGVRLYHCRYCRIQFYDLPRGSNAGA